MSLSASMPKSSYAFSAHNLSASTPSVGSTLVFTHTLLNEDEVYNTTTGMFTAQRDGLYEFQASLTPGQSKKVVRVEFNARGSAIGRFSVYDNYNPSTSFSSAITRLQEGEQVYLKVSGMTSGFRFREGTQYMNTFSGHLINIKQTRN